MKLPYCMIDGYDDSIEYNETGELDDKIWRGFNSRSLLFAEKGERGTLDSEDMWINEIPLWTLYGI